MHVLSNKDSNPAELETVQVSRHPTTVFAANGSTETNEEATVYVRDVDLFVTGQFRKDTPLVPALGKLCEYHRYSYQRIEGQEPNLQTNEGKYCAISITACP